MRVCVWCPSWEACSDSVALITVTKISHSATDNTPPACEADLQVCMSVCEYMCVCVCCCAAPGDGLALCQQFLWTLPVQADSLPAESISRHHRIQPMCTECGQVTHATENIFTMQHSRRKFERKSLSSKKM